MAGLLSSLIGISISASLSPTPTLVPSSTAIPSGGIVSTSVPLGIPIVPTAIPINDGNDINSTVLKDIFNPLLDPLLNLSTIALNGRDEVNVLNSSLGSLSKSLGPLANLASLSSLGDLSALGDIATALESLSLLNMLNGSTPTNPLLEKLSLLADSGTSNLTQISPYCSIQSVGRQLANNSADVLNSTAIPVGQPLSFKALLPVPGVPLPAIGDALMNVEQNVNSTVSNQTILPLATVLGSLWVVEYSTDAHNWFPAKAAANTSDTGAQYQLLKGTHTDLLTSFVLWPDPTTNDNGQTFVNPTRYFRFSLNVTSWWPSKEQPLIERVNTTYYAKSDSWHNALPDLKDQYKNLISIPTATLAPAIGQVVEIAAIVTDLTEQIPEIASAIVKTSPKVRVTAGLELGAVIANAGKLLGSVVGGSVGNTLSSGAVSVGSILSSLTSIPIAVDIDGSSLTKTLLPTDPIPIGSVKQLEGLGGMVGKLPVGSLFTQMTADASNIQKSFEPGVKVQSSLLPGGRLGFNILPLPELVALGSSTALNPLKTTHITISLSFNLTLPGSTQAFPVSLPGVSIPLVLPRIPIPQVAMFGHVCSQKDRRRDVLMTVDPATADYFGGAFHVESLMDHLTSVKSLLGTVVSVFGGTDGIGVLNSNAANDYIGLLNVVSRMIQRVAVLTATGAVVDVARPVALDSPNVGGSKPSNDWFRPRYDGQRGSFARYSSAQYNSGFLRPVAFFDCCSDNENGRKDTDWWDGTKNDHTDHTYNVGNILWFGAPRYAGDWVLQFQLDNYNSPTDTMEMGHYGVKSGVWNLQGYSSRGAIMRYENGSASTDVTQASVDDWFQQLRFAMWAKIEDGYSFGGD